MQKPITKSTKPPLAMPNIIPSNESELLVATSVVVRLVLVV